MSAGVTSVVSAGECMIELVELGDGLMRRGFGGDTLNTAIYLRRCLDPQRFTVSYMTVLGDDPYSDEMVGTWKGEGLDCSLVGRSPGSLPGIHAVRTDASGERMFHYWRDRAPVRDLYRDDAYAELLAASTSADLFYFSGITLAILDDPSRHRLLDDLRRRRENGGRIAFDPNLRLRIWQDAGIARHWFKAVYPLCDFLLPTFDDEIALWRDSSPQDVIERIGEQTEGEIVVKCGSDATHARACGQGVSVKPETVRDPVDTTGAGDSFNAAYLAARLEGASLQEAVHAGQNLAAHVIRHPGAIAPPLG